jgi:hypothetical protein
MITPPQAHRNEKARKIGAETDLVGSYPIRRPRVAVKLGGFREQ